MCEDTRCPCCGGKAKYRVHENGGHESQCLACGWWERVPGSDAISAAITLHGGETAQSPQRLPQCVSVCANCGRTFTDEEELAEISELWGRVLPGDTMPGGECPDCGALCYPADAEEEHGRESQPAGERQPQTIGNVDRDLLERQAAILGRIVDGNDPTEEERLCLERLWELVHTILDGPQAHGHKPRSPTVVLFVEGGAVQGVEGDGRVRVILCDFDFTDGPQTVGGRPCHVGVWDSPEPPSEEFNEVLEVVARNDSSVGEHVEEHDAERP